MSGYLLSIIGIVLISAIISALTPEGKTSAVIKGAAKLCCLIVILSPIVNFFIGKGGDGEKIFSVFSKESVIQTDEAFINYCSNKRIESTQKQLEEKIKEDYDCFVCVSFVWEYEENEVEIFSLKGYEDREIKIKKILITSERETKEEVKAQIERELSSLYGCEVAFC